MKYDFKLEVTEKDIAEGERGVCTSCPLARAAKRFFAPATALGMIREIWVSHAGVISLLLFGGSGLSFKAPWASRFVNRFDHKEHVAAQTFYFTAIL